MSYDYDDVDYEALHQRRLSRMFACRCNSRSEEPCSGCQAKYDYQAEQQERRDEESED